MYSNPFVAMCRDLANASKHFELRSDYRDRVTDEVSVASGYGAGRFGVDAYGVGEPSVIIVREDRSRINALEFADKTLETWREFFAQNGL